MLKFRDQRFFSTGPNLLGFMLFMAGLIAFGSIPWTDGEAIRKTIYVGLGGVLLGGLLMSIQKGILLDLKNQRYRNYESILGFQAGDWQSLPPIQRMELIQHSFTRKNVPNGITPTFDSKITLHKVVLLAEDVIALSINFYSEKSAVRAMEKIQANLPAIQTFKNIS